MFGGAPQVDVDWYPHWLSPDEATVAFSALVDEVPWKQDLIRTPGGIKPLPRLTAWQGDPGAVYVYSGIRNEPLAWTPTVFALKSLAETECEMRFNSVLLNRYRSGDDSMGWHADREPELGTEPVIASVSLGVARRFDLRHNETGQLRAFELTSGSLLVMRGRTQHDWRHRIAKVSGLRGERINLTFRFVRTRDDANRSSRAAE